MIDASSDSNVLSTLSRSELAVLGREIMMCAQLNDRVGLPLVGRALGAEAMERTAIDEWMGASPIYTRRMREALRFEGDDVATIMKGLQLDVGFAHQYFDVAYEVESETRGSFRLRRCGALIDVEPFGEELVTSMCHHIEDPTFDATAVATNPRARIRPIHRPPRRPADRSPHCHWTIEIDSDADPVREVELTKRVRASRLAALPVTRPADREAGGWPDYDRAFDPDFQLEDLSHGALVAVCTELAIQANLLVRSFQTTVTDQGGSSLAQRITEEQWTGSGWVVSERLHRALGGARTGVGAILRALSLHPAFVSPYVSATFECDEDGAGRICMEDCEALREADAIGWLPLLAEGRINPLEAMARGVDPRARVEPIPGSDLSWRVTLGSEEAPEPEPARLARVSGASGFSFQRLRKLRA